LARPEDLVEGEASPSEGRSNISRSGAGDDGRSSTKSLLLPPGPIIGNSKVPLVPPGVATPKSPLLAGPFRVGNIVEAGLGSAMTESAGLAEGVANLVEHFGHRSFRPAADSGTFSTTPQWGHWIVRVMVFWPTEAAVGYSGTLAIGGTPSRFGFRGKKILPGHRGPV